MANIIIINSLFLVIIRLPYCSYFIHRYRFKTIQYSIRRSEWLHWWIFGCSGLQYNHCVIVLVWYVMIEDLAQENAHCFVDELSIFFLIFHFISSLNSMFAQYSIRVLSLLWLTWLGIRFNPSITNIATYSDIPTTKARMCLFDWVIFTPYPHDKLKLFLYHRSRSIYSSFLEVFLDFYETVWREYSQIF